MGGTSITVCRVIIISLLFVIMNLCVADVVYKKDGSILIGSVMALNKDKNYRIRLSGGSVFVVLSREVEKVTFVRNEESKLKDEIHKSDGSILMGWLTEGIPNVSYKIALEGGSSFVVKDEEIEEILFSSSEDENSDIAPKSPFRKDNTPAHIRKHEEQRKKVVEKAVDVADMVYKKDGSVLKGSVVEIDRNGNYKVQLAGGSIFVVSSGEVEKLTFARNKESDQKDEIHKSDGSIIMGWLTEGTPNVSYKIALEDGSSFVIKDEEIEEIIFLPLLEVKEKETVSQVSYKRSHLGLGLGLYAASEKDLGVEFSKGSSFLLEYRYSITEDFDAVFESRGWFVESSAEVLGITVDAEITASFHGVGFRLTELGGSGYRPIGWHWFGQCCLYVVNENIQTLDGVFNTDNSGLGIGISSGYDVKVSDGISIYLKTTWIRTTSSEDEKMDDLSGIGASGGVNFNF